MFENLSERQIKLKYKLKDGRRLRTKIALSVRATKRYWENRDKILPKAKKYRRKLRYEVLQSYGAWCHCPCGCKQRQPMFLAIDHVNGDGYIHKKERRGSLYGWLRQHGFPKKGFQVLCHNCNMAKGIYGVCPGSITNEKVDVSLFFA